MTHEMDLRVASIAPDLASSALSPGALDLMNEITALPRPADSEVGAERLLRRAFRLMGTPRRRRIRWALTVPLAAAAAVLLSLGLQIGPASAPASALDIRIENGFYVITVKQLFDDPKRYERELRARGLHLDLRVVPASPGLVGAVMPPIDERYNGLTAAEIANRPDLISSIQAPGTCADELSCIIGFRVPVNYQGPIQVTMGRAGRPGERFMAFGQLNNSGEPLQCVPLANRRVDDVLALLAAKGITVGTYAVPDKGYRTSVPGSWRVHEGWLREPGKALLVVDTAPTPEPRKPICS